MKALKYIAIAATLLLSSCQTHEKKNKLYEEGISLELAQLRKQEIKELKYGLCLSCLAGCPAYEEYVELVNRLFKEE